MSINIDYHNVSKIELLPVEKRVLGNSGEKYSLRRIVVHIGDKKHEITLYGAELDSLDVGNEVCSAQSSATSEQSVG